MSHGISRKCKLNKKQTMIQTVYTFTHFCHSGVNLVCKPQQCDLRLISQWERPIVLRSPCQAKWLCSYDGVLMMEKTMPCTLSWCYWPRFLVVIVLSPTNCSAPAPSMSWQVRELNILSSSMSLMSMSGATDGMSSTHWQYSTIIFSSINTVLR